MAGIAAGTTSAEVGDVVGLDDLVEGVPHEVLAKLVKSEAPDVRTAAERGLGWPSAAGASTVAAYATALVDAVRIGDPEQGLRVFLQWVDDFRRLCAAGAHPGQLAWLCSEPDPITDPRWDSLVAGVVLHWTRTWRVATPAWASRRAHRLPTAFYPAGPTTRPVIFTLAEANIYLAEDWTYTA